MTEKPTSNIRRRLNESAVPSGLLVTVGYTAFLLAAAEILLLASRRTRRREYAGDRERGPDLPWPQSEIVGFYAGLGLVLAVLTSFISTACLFRYASLPALMAHGTVVICAVLSARRSLRLHRQSRVPEERDH